MSISHHEKSPAQGGEMPPVERAADTGGRGIDTVLGAAPAGNAAQERNTTAALTDEQRSRVEYALDYMGGSGFAPESDILRALLTSPRAASVPTGWNLLPSKLTEDMHAAAVRVIARCHGNDDWPPAVLQAFIDAAPAAPIAEPTPDPLRRRVERLLVELHAEGRLSEGQCAKMLDIPRIDWRELAEFLAPAAQAVAADREAQDDIEGIARAAGCTNVDLIGDRAKAIERLTAFAVRVRAAVSPATADKNGWASFETWFEPAWLLNPDKDFSDRIRCKAWAWKTWKHLRGEVPAPAEMVYYGGSVEAGPVAFDEPATGAHVSLHDDLEHTKAVMEGRAPLTLTINPSAAPLTMTLSATADERACPFCEIEHDGNSCMEAFLEHAVQAYARSLPNDIQDTLKLAIGYIGSSERADRHEHVARIRAILDGASQATAPQAATADERAAFWAWFDSEWKREERDAGKITCGAWAWKTWKHLRASQAAAPADAISLLRKAHRTLACAALTQIRDGEAVWTEIGRFLDAAPAEAREQFQARVQPWMMECFGPTIAADRVERNHRFLEEALETVQSLGCTASEAHQLVDYTFGRPVGEPAQEVGGVMVTLAALCLANTLDMHAAGETELARISEPATVLKIRAKQAAKPKHSPLPQAVTTRAPYEWRDTGPLETNEGGAA
ncbi:hypothetical protein [Burkholderia gladioli]|uniref:hypothetical protein n=1 Tax=Burkholderia gladioli TaxID=28095 RepID=UPI002FE3C8AF